MSTLPDYGFEVTADSELTIYDDDQEALAAALLEAIEETVEAASDVVRGTDLMYLCYDCGELDVRVRSRSDDTFGEDY